jgi:hypothetical protein
MGGSKSWRFISSTFQGVKKCAASDEGEGYGETAQVRGMGDLCLRLIVRQSPHPALSPGGEGEEQRRLDQRLARGRGVSCRNPVMGLGLLV